MNKLISIILLAMIICTFTVYAKEADNGKFQDPLIGQKEQTETMLQVKHVNITGFENAVYRVRDNTTAHHLEQVMERVRTQQRSQLIALSGLEITDGANNGLVAEGKKQAKLLGIIPWQKTHTYLILENGNMTYQKGQFDFLFTIEE